MRLKSCVPREILCISCNLVYLVENKMCTHFLGVQIRMNFLITKGEKLSIQPQMAEAPWFLDCLHVQNITIETEKRLVKL